MRNKIPADAFEYYRDLGPTRTYAAVATKFGVSVRGVTKRAVKEDWQGRLQRIEAEARKKQDERAVEDVAAVDDRHLKMSRAIQARALETLKSSPLHSGMSAVRALDVAIKIERAILGRSGKDGAAAPPQSHAAVAEMSASFPRALIDLAALDWKAMDAAARVALEARLAAALQKTDKGLPPPAEPVVPPALLPRVYGEN